MRSLAVLPLLCAMRSAPARAATCDNLAALAIPATAITAAAAVAAGSPAAGGRGPALTLPAFCRVTAVARPVPDSEIKIEVWLPPAQRWNGKLIGTGNGGYSGSMSFGDMESGLRQGYAVAGSDTGHQGGELKFGLGHPEKIRDWGDRAVHVMAETARLIVRSYYGRFAAHAYFTGCSTGGHQALTEAQRYPADYDGIVAGDPGNNRVRLNIGFLWSWLAVHKGAEFPASKLPLITAAAIAACDSLDGVKDGLIADPRACPFDPAALLCKGADDGKCLTEPQAAAVRAVYAGAHNPRTGERLFAGWPRGSESGWGGYFVGQREPARLDFWRYWVFHDPAWDFRSFDFDRDAAYADEKMSILVANNPDLGAFARRNGKLLLYHGLADPVAPPEDTIRYFEDVAHAMGGPEKTAGFIRLFLAPGMGHCRGGPGPDTFDALGALDKWVTEGAAPDRIIASHAKDGAVDRTRPLCPYPLVARWNGSGSIDDAAAFTCAAGARP
jgi:Tannase and feruloyl esterase